MIGLATTGQSRSSGVETTSARRLAQLVGATASVLGDRLAGPGLAELGKAGGSVSGTPAPAGAMFPKVA